MPITRLPEFEETGNAGKRRDFVLWVRKTLGHLVEQADREYPRVFVPALIGPMRDAWREVEPEFEVLAGSVADLTPGRVVRHGLGGAQLDFKLATVRYWAQRFIDQQPIAPVWSVKGLLWFLLNAINTLLKCLASAVGRTATSLSLRTVPEASGRRFTTGASPSSASARSWWW